MIITSIDDVFPFINNGWKMFVDTVMSEKSFQKQSTMLVFEREEPQCGSFWDFNYSAFVIEALS